VAAWCISDAYLGILAIYTATTFTYSFLLKRLLILDVLTLSGLYTLRILAGGVATGIQVSNWLLTFSLFIFLSLALAKRYVELSDLAGRSESQTIRRGYFIHDALVLLTFGAASSMAAIVILCLYISSHEVSLLYSRHDYLWLTLPFFIYWIIRLYMIASRGGLHDDPLVWAFHDKASYILAFAILILLMLAV
jgi:4-hydroxybenzoate polyprenyltransferase